jgi:hypothetical protein
MIKNKRNARPARVVDEHDFQIKSIRMKKDGTNTEHSSVDIRDSTLKEAIDRTCDLQDEFDQDSDPVRVYLYKKEDPNVPVYAAYARYYDWRQFNEQHRSISNG